MPIPLPPRAPARARPSGTTAAGPIPNRPRQAALRRRTVLLALLALAGCKLIDQTTFAPAPGPAPVAPAPKVDSRTPLLTIGPGTPVSGYRTLLGFAVRAAEQRDRNVRFDVTAVAPAGLPPAKQAAEIEAAETEATRVMHAIAETGVPPDRILLRAVLAPATPHREVRVYVR